PEENDTCVYCLQPLDDSAKELLKNYRTLLNDRTQEDLLALKKQKDDLIKLVSGVETDLIFNQSTFGRDENHNVVQPKEIIDYNKNLSVLKTTFIKGSIAQDSTFNLDYQVISAFLTNKRTAINNALIGRSEAFADLGAREEALKKEIDE